MLELSTNAMSQPEQTAAPADQQAAEVAEATRRHQAAKQSLAEDLVCTRQYIESWLEQTKTSLATSYKANLPVSENMFARLQQEADNWLRKKETDLQAKYQAAQQAAQTALSQKQAMARHWLTQAEAEVVQQYQARRAEIEFSYQQLKPQLAQEKAAIEVIFDKIQTRLKKAGFASLLGPVLAVKAIDEALPEHFDFAQTLVECRVSLEQTIGKLEETLQKLENQRKHWWVG